jgi:phospholipid/cholesterol/gamma-HCH transport system ATP-binding protein
MNPTLRDEMARLKAPLSGLPLQMSYLYPSQLSGGMKKSAGAARALAMDPEQLFSMNQPPG